MVTEPVINPVTTSGDGLKFSMPTVPEKLTWRLRVTDAEFQARDRTG
jgi:hypothetical protein